MGNFEWDSCVTQSIGMDFPLTSVGRDKFHVSLLVCFLWVNCFYCSVLSPLNNLFILTQHWGWRLRVIPTYRQWHSRLHGVIKQKHRIRMFSVAKTSSPMRYYCLLYIVLWCERIITAWMYSCNYTECPHTVYSLHCPHRYIVPAVNKNPAVRLNPQNSQWPWHLDQ